MAEPLIAEGEPQGGAWERMLLRVERERDDYRAELERCLKDEALALTRVRQLEAEVASATQACNVAVTQAQKAERECDRLAGLLCDVLPHLEGGHDEARIWAQNVSAALKELE